MNAVITVGTGPSGGRCLFETDVFGEASDVVDDVPGDVDPDVP